jgi:hypothetical protein
MAGVAKVKIAAVQAQIRESCRSILFPCFYPVYIDVVALLSRVG